MHMQGGIGDVKGCAAAVGGCCCPSRKVILEAAVGHYGLRRGGKGGTRSSECCIYIGVGADIGFKIISSICPRQRRWFNAPFVLAPFTYRDAIVIRCFVGYYVARQETIGWVGYLQRG